MISHSHICVEDKESFKWRLLVIAASSGLGMRNEKNEKTKEKGATIHQLADR